MTTNMEKPTNIEIVEKPAEVESFISLAIQNKLPIETLERLFALREKDKAEKAREAFTDAMASFQAACPVIEKTKAVMNKDGKTVRYKYAPLDSIVSQVKKPLADAGLSYSFDEKKDEKTITAICKITHKLGHSETSSFQIPIGSEEYMSDPQKHGARITFAKRYAFCNALGILTGDEDTDAADDEQKKINDKIESLKPEIAKTSTLEELRKIYEENKGLGKEFAKLVTEHKKFIMEADKE